MVHYVECISPIDDSVYARRPVATWPEVERTFRQARDAQAGWRQTPLTDRAALCGVAVEAMVSMTEEIVPELAWQMGRPVRYGAGEVRGFEERARHMISVAPEALADLRPRPIDGFVRYIRREPLGVVLTIAPWNYPYLTAVNSIVPALLAGNTVILKHAAATLIVAERFQAAFDRAGLPDGVFQHLVLSHDQTAQAIGGGLADMVCFTGSVPAGRAIEEAAAGGFIHVGLELGGKDPAYVRPDADLDHAIANLVDGSFFNSGQSCCGIERIYVHRDVWQPFLDGFVDLAGQYVLGSPLDEATTLGPMVRTSAAESVRRQIDAAVQAGAVAHLDPRAFPADRPGSPYLAPQVLTGVDHAMSVMTDESFGPVVGLMAVGDDNEAIRLMNDSCFGLTASVWTSDLEAAQSIGNDVTTGTVYMNRCDYLDPALAWTGVKDTGRGATLSTVGFESLTRPKSFHLRTET
ncbi:MAG: aldehyde dehydrogenase family protein [Acidimicrobiia bacterium]|nr:aldehyde dehydrogenase family protein [Acidimicrobiia bacterium]MDH4309241.1 aldehyde dehydrogenase family protein [Acidimicrobiia bacterium]